MICCDTYSLFAHSGLEISPLVIEQTNQFAFSATRRTANGVRPRLSPSDVPQGRTPSFSKLCSQASGALSSNPIRKRARLASTSSAPTFDRGRYRAADAAPHTQGESDEKLHLDRNHLALRRRPTNSNQTPIRRTTRKLEVDFSKTLASVQAGGRPAQISRESAPETMGGTGDDCSFGNRGVWPPECGDGYRLTERRVETRVTGEERPAPIFPAPTLSERRAGA